MTRCPARAGPLLPLLLLSLSACGFELRGARATASLGQVALSQVNASGVGEALRLALGRAGAALASAGDAAAWRVRVAEERLHRDLLSVDPATGKAEEYQISLSALLRLEDQQGQVLIDEPVQVFREYRYDLGQALAMSEQERQIEQDLRQLWAQRALGRIDRVASRHAGSPH